MAAREFPISPLLPAILESLAATPRLVLEAPPGAGKTTQVPLALLAAPWMAGKKLILLEPRRLAARAAAGFMAEQLGEQVGATVGYRIRFDSKVSSTTRIEVVTEAILTRMLQDDPELPGIGAVLFDEFHERHLDSDLGLALALESQAGLRDDLRIVVMSATLDGERLSRHLDAPRLTAEGRAFPVDVVHVPERPGEDERVQLRRAIDQALSDTDGDVLVFLPGKFEIERARRMLETVWPERPIDLLVLHGELGLDAQRAALAPAEPGRRRVVLSTNVAESSVTLPGVRAVVDSGLAREPRFDPDSGMSRLVTVTIPLSSATQRAGRAGRVAPGRCYRLWPQSQRLDPAVRPEILQVELSSLALELAAWGSAELRWLDPPPPGPMAQARELLAAIGALDGAGRITRHGRELARLPLAPAFAHAVLVATPDLRALACDAVALIEARDPFRGPAARNDDLRLRLAALQRFRRDGRRAAGEADVNALAAIDQAAQQLARRVGASRRAPHADDEHHLGELLAPAFPDRIARRVPDTALRYQLANGRGAHLADGSVLAGSHWLLVSDLRFAEKDSTILRAAPLSESWLKAALPGRFSKGLTRSFNPSSAAVEAVEEERFGAIVLARRQQASPRDADSTAMLLAGLAALGSERLPWTENLRQWQTRVICLRDWCPELGLPDVADAALLSALPEWLGPYVAGKLRLSELDSGTLGEALAALLDHRQRRQLDEQVPVQLTVPSGMSRRLEYHEGQPPVLAVKLQELFGLADGPRVANGRIAVTLHLLSPGQRPIQVTQDLKGFWERTYPEVRKELAGRYPRHPWPLDPWSAKPTARAKPRGT